MVTTRRQSYPQVIGGADTEGDAQKVTKEDAMAFLCATKKIFENNVEKYDDFIQTMLDLKAQRINFAVAVARLKELFKGHPILILGFNKFLPKGYAIPLPLLEHEVEDSIKLMNKLQIQTRFKGEDNDIYELIMKALATLKI